MKIQNNVSLNPYQTSLKQNSKSEEDFGKFLWKEIKKVDESQKQVQKMLEDLSEGKEVSLSDLALSFSKAEIEFNLLLRVRNKIIDAYQEIMRMQI
jgi:flagellar hook-basal body complex protein FliE